MELRPMKKNVIYIVALLLFSLHAYCQRKDILLNKTIGRVPLNSFQKALNDEDSSVLKIPAGIDLKYFNRYVFDLAPLAELFRKYKNGGIDYSQFLARAKKITLSAIDTAALSVSIQRFAAAGDYVHFISGIDGTGNKIIMVDADGDGIITNNEIFTFTQAMIDSVQKHSRLRDTYPNLPLKQIASDGGVTELNVKIIPYSYINRKTDTKHYKETDFTLMLNEYWSGSATIAGQQIIVYASSKTFVNELNLMQLKLSCNKVFDNFGYDVKDDWSNDSVSFTFDSLSPVNSKQLRLSVLYQSPPRKTGDTTFGMSLQNVSGKNFETLHPLLHKSKYILIDYWGTWCIPCIEEIPALKELQADYFYKLSMVSIAYDEDINTVNSFEKDHGMNWSSYFIHRNNAHNLTKPLKISMYPTLRLYDENGKLLYNGEFNPDKDLENIRQILSK